MAGKETVITNLASNLIADKNQNANKNKECKVKCSHELDMNDENEHLNVIDAISVQTELEQLFNDFNIYNHHIRVFKKLLNLKELKNQYNFFSFNHRQTSDQTNSQSSNKLNEIICCASSSIKNHSADTQSVIQSPFERLDELSSTLFRGGALSAMQVHSQLSKIRDQFLESQMLVTCLIHNVHSLRKHHCGTALDLVSSSELLSNLEKDHTALKRCKSIFKYQCTKKREQLEKLKQQLKRAHEDWSQLIVREPVKHQLSNEELLLISKTQTKRKRKSIENQLTSKISGQEDKRNNELNNELDKQLSKESSLEDNNVDSGNVSESNDLSQNLFNKEVDKDKNRQTSTGSSGSNCDSAVHSESESMDSMQELAAAIYRRKSKLDRLEKECYTFMSRLANRNKTLNDNVDEHENLAQLDGQLDQLSSNLIIDDVNDLNNENYDDYVNEYDEDLLDEEYDDVEFDEIINDPFTTAELDIETLLNRFSNVQTLDTEQELIVNRNLESDTDGLIFDNSIPMANSTQNLTTSNEMDNDLYFVNGQETLINQEIRTYSADYLIGQSRSIQSRTDDHPNIINDLNESSTDQEPSNDSSSNFLSTENQVDRAFDFDELASRSRLDLSRGSLNSLVDQTEANTLSSSIFMSRISNEETAKTGEPISLCRLRRRAVKILASRIRTEKEYYEGKESELRQKLDELHFRNEELKNQLAQSTRFHKQIFLISTAFVFCSLIHYFTQTI